jgi:hypothetical protein
MLVVAHWWQGVDAKFSTYEKLRESYANLQGMLIARKAF